MVKVKTRDGRTHLFRIDIARVPKILEAQEAFGAFALPDEDSSWIAVTSIDWATAMSTIVSIPPVVARRTV